MHGQFAWYELTTSDAEAAQKFYSTFTGWGAQRFDDDYTLLTSNGVPVAGVFRLTDEMRARGIPPNWMPYVEAANVAETAKLAETLGASIVHGPVTIPGVGDIAVIQDPEGAAFGVYKSTSGGQSWDGTPVVGRFSWNELMAIDHSSAFNFYRRIFGWEKISEMDMGDGLMYLLFGKGGAMYGGMFTRPAEMSGMHPFWLCYIHVEDVPESLAMATKSGAFVHRPPTDIPDGVIAILGDPQGAGFALHHNNPANSRQAPSKREGAATTARARKSAKRKRVAKRASRHAKAFGKTRAKRTSKSASKSRGKGKARSAVKSSGRRTSKPAARTQRRKKAVKASTQLLRARRMKKAASRRAGGSTSARRARRPARRK